MQTTYKNASSSHASSHACGLCDGTEIVSRGTQAGSACCCHPAWSSHFEMRRNDIIAGMVGFSNAEATTHNPCA